MQCILYKIYFWKVFHMCYNLICIFICTRFLFLKNVSVTPWDETHLSDLLLNAPKLGRQCEHHVDVYAGWWRRPVFDQRSLVVIQQVHVVIRGRGCRGVDL
jgi:hypothetical protein